MQHRKVITPRSKTLRQKLYGKKTELKYARKNRESEKMIKFVSEIKQIKEEMARK